MILKLTRLTTIGRIRIIMIMMRTKTITIKLRTMTTIGTIRMITIMMTTKKCS